MSKWMIFGINVFILVVFLFFCGIVYIGSILYFCKEVKGCRISGYRRYRRGREEKWKR